MRVWVDAQLSPRIARWLSARFAVEATPVRDLGLREASDERIFDAVRSAGAVGLTTHYANLWYAASTTQLPTATNARPMLPIDAFRPDAWTRQDPRLPNDWPALTPRWHRDHALRTGYARRMAPLSARWCMLHASTGHSANRITKPGRKQIGIA